MEIYEESKMHVKKENNRKMRKYRNFENTKMVRVMKIS